jgi:hypothetical protein
MTRPILRGVLLAAVISCLPLSSGCDTIGAIGGVVAQAVPHYTDAAYKGLPGQTVVVMVWVDRGIKLDNPDLQISVAAGLQGKLIDIQATEHPDALKGTVFPVRAATVIRYQDDHPEIENEPLTATAAKFDATRLIYVEVTSFETRSEAVELFRGSMRGNVKVLEMKDGTAKQVFAENDIEVVFPKDSTKEGTTIGTDYKFSQGTVDAFTDQVARRFYRSEDAPE